MDKKNIKGTKLTNPIALQKVMDKLKSSCLTKKWDNFDTIFALDLLDQLSESYAIMLHRYFGMMNLDISSLETLEDLYFIDETETQVLFVDEERH